MAKIIKNTALGICVLNEESSLVKTLNSILSQTVYPEKLVIVDGGSTDKTSDIIAGFRPKFEALKIKFIFLLCDKGLAESRNAVIKKSGASIIVFTDAGCYATKNWFETLINCLLSNPDVEIASGFYKLKADSAFSKAYACFVAVLPKYLYEKSFLPSTRSVAIKASVFRKIGCFNPKLKVGEDTEFFYRAAVAGIKFKLCQKAQVVWFELSKIDLFSAAKKFYSYAKADALTGILWHPRQRLNSHFIKIMTIYLRYLIFSVVLFYNLKLFFSVFAFYLFYSYNKFFKQKIPATVRVYFPLLQLVSDLAVMFGFLSGSLIKFFIYERRSSE
ncbi:MAG: hypothetical protein KatS3mg090_0457 [Patescibacteria group bacterium]|nr:MAG: hypothetical protein KatS3mg090_0457 [Patescibacteria group bacterium]